MMYMPSIFRDNLMDDWMDDFGRDFFQMGRPDRRPAQVMKTDVTERDNGYDVAIDLPGFKKEDIEVELKDGYLTVKAEKDENQEEKNTEGKVIRRERYTGRMQRSFYVGKLVKQEDIHAKFENGVLALDIPKKEPKEEIPQKQTIAIEG